MSKESVQAFFDAIENDKTLMDRLRAAESAEAVIKLGEERGYSFTAEELKAAYADEGLSDEQLDAVAGGMMMYCTSKKCCDRG